MKTYVLNSVGYALHIQALKESYYFVPGAKAAHKNKNRDATVDCAISGINMTLQTFITVLKGMRNRMEIKEFETRVIEIIQRTQDVKSFRFYAPEDAEFNPGQYFVLTIKINERDATKHFSFSNSPSEKGYIEFTKRITSSEFSQALNRLTINDWARIRLPFGFFTFEGEYEKIAFLSGGIGITAIRSMCKFSCDKKLSTDIILLYGNSTENDIPFREDFSRMQAENKRLKVIHTLTSSLDENRWKGRTGPINSVMVREEIPDYKERVFYICGPPKMVEALKSILSDELKLDREKIKWEHFLGYD